MRAPGRDADSRGLWAVERADSEGVGELLQENFESSVVSGVEAARMMTEKKFDRASFPEDDVPEEYLDKD